MVCGDQEKVLAVLLKITKDSAAGFQEGTRPFPFPERRKQELRALKTAILISERVGLYREVETRSGTAQYLIPSDCSSLNR